MAKQRVKHFEAGGGAYGDVTLDDGTTVNTDPTDTDVDIGTDLGPAPALTPEEEAARDAADQQALIDAGIPVDTAAALKSTPGLWDKIVSKFTDPKTGDLNWANIAKAVIPVAGGIAALNGNSSAASGAQGYQGGIPSLTLSRTKNAIPTDRRPGAGGVSYFSPTTYLGNRNMAPGPAGGTAGSVTTPPVGRVGGSSGSSGSGIAALPGGSAKAPAAGAGDGMWVQGMYLTAPQIKAAFAQPGFDPNEWAQKNGITNPDQIHQLATQARTIAGTSNPTGEAALQAAWQSYKKYNPQGAGVNDYASFVANIAPNRRDAIMAGTYTGAFNDQRDYAPGGIYEGRNISYQQAGLGSRGDGSGVEGDAWVAAPAAAATPSGSDILSWYKQHQNDANFQQEAQQAMQQYGLNAQQVAAAGVPTSALQQPAAAAAPTDWSRYMQLNPDLGAAGISTAAAAQQHWQQFGQNENRQFAKGGGISGLPGAAPSQGRFLRGPGDGVSDSIPARIDGKKPAAIADGEFIIPARAVSEIGNGSSEAGSRKLYAMLDRIEKTRHRNKNTAKDTRADKHLPA